MPRRPRLAATIRLALAVSLVAAETGGCGGERPAAGKAAPAAPSPPRADAHGFNDAIAWVSLDDGLAEAARTGKPVMLLVHASWCSKCKALRPAFFDPRLVEASRQFVMVNVDQDEVPQVKAYAPDGEYIPRILFLDPSTGEVDASLKNPGRRRFLYFYGPQDDLVSVMERARARHGSAS